MGMGCCGFRYLGGGSGDGLGQGGFKEKRRIKTESFDVS